MKELITIQHALKAPKGQRNDFGKFNYRSCEDILEALKPLLHETGCYLTLSDEIIAIGNRFYVQATATLTNSEGTQITTRALAREEDSKKGMDGSQVTGAASSYARKYALNGLFCIDDTKDADTNEHQKQQQQPTVAPPFMDDNLALAIDEIKRTATIEQLQQVWTSYKCYQTDPTFVARKNERKLQLVG